MNYFAISPVSLFFLPWTIVLILYSFGATENLVDLPTSLIALLIYIFLIFSLVTFLSYINYRDIRRLKSTWAYEPRSISRLKKAINIQFILWFVGTIFEIYKSGGLPIFWAILGDSKNYTDFGIPSFHGLMNGIYFSLLACLYYYYKVTNDKRFLFYTLLMLTWPIFMLGRGIMLTVLVQMGIIYIFFVKIKIKTFIYLILFGFFVVIGFGVIGNARGHANPFSYLVARDYEHLFETLPNGFLWFYIYMTSPLSNLAYNFNTLNPVWDFYYSSVNLFPSFLRPANLDRADAFRFVDVNLNVSTIFASSHSDFGVIGNFILITILALWAAFWFKNMRASIVYILPYSLVGVILFFSVFYNLFLLYPYLFATILLGLVAKFINR
jgi:oligosaccharide repeat unit polymerase